MVDADFIIVVKYDSDERRHNTSLVYQYLEQYCPPERIHVFESSETPFHRTHYINTMIKQLDAPIIGIWDADVILPYSQMKCAISYVREGVTIAYPYNGRFVDVPREDQNDFYTMFTKETTYMSLSENSDSVGGAFFINKERYTKCGLENENFISWGCEDRERFARVLKLGHVVTKVGGTLFHLHHERGPDSWFSNPFFETNHIEQKKVEAMTKEELQEYVKTWTWVK
jgi:hypothetical protein